MELVSAGEELARNRPKLTLKADSFRSLGPDMAGIVSENICFANITWIL